MRGFLGIFGGLIFILCVPLIAFITGAFTMVFDPGFYSQGQIEQRVEATYGLPPRVLQPVNRAIVRYFASNSDTLASSLENEGADQKFFNEREIVHMSDVRGLISTFRVVQRVAFIYAIIFLILSLLLQGSRAVERIGRYSIVGAVFTIVLVVVFGSLALIDFDNLFTRFHLISFSNDFWLLDPKTDRLIQMFPFDFWYNATIAIVVQALGITVGIAALGGLFVWLGRRLL